MDKYNDQIKDVHRLTRDLFESLEKASEGKLSTNEINSDRLLWEIFNKIFNIIVICENSLAAKDSLTIHLIARYTYEMLVVFAFIFFDKAQTPTRIQQFVEFNQFKETKRMWTDKTFSEMINSIPQKSWLSLHKDHYRTLSNFAHPTMDSFLLNRRGEEAEFLTILNTVLLIINTIIEIIRISFDQNLYFSDEQKRNINLDDFSSRTNKIFDTIKISK